MKVLTPKKYYWISCLMIFSLPFVQAQIAINSSAVPTFNTAGQGDLYVDENDLYYIGLQDGSLKEIGIVTAEGTADGDILVWDNAAGKWVAEANFPQILVDVRRSTNYTAPTGNNFNVLVYNSASINVGSAYNTGTGIFTAPDDGTYEIQMHNVYRPGTSNDTRLQVRVVVNANVELQLGVSSSPYNQSNAILTTVTGNTIVELSAGQSIQVQVGNRLNNLNPQTGIGQHNLKIIRLK